MKKIVTILLLITTFTVISSCKKALDAPTQSSLDESVIFSTPSLAQGAIAGILQSFGETNSYRGRYILYYGSNTDAEASVALRSINDKSRMGNYDNYPKNTEMNIDNPLWAKMYEGIERANLAIRGLRTYGSVETNPDLAQMLGEVLTLRAVLFADLIKGWGDVPARFEPVTSETTYLPRTDRDVIYKQLLADLDEAAGLLPWPNETPVTSSVEHVNKAFAKGLRARIALAAGGYAQRLDGTVRKSTDPDLASDKMYAIAKQECLDVIKSEKLHLFTGATGFETIFKTLHLETNRAGLESMWEIPFSAGRGRVIFNLGVKHTTTDKYTTQAQGGTVGPTPIMLYEYEKEDVRRDVTVVPYEWTNGMQVPSGLNKLYFGKYRYEWLKRDPISTSADDGLNWMYMRYADVILMAAEAINEIDGPNAAAPYLKMIRDRAYPNNPEKVTAYMATVTASPGAFFTAIVNERALEFTGEMLRKADLIRWNKLKEKIDEAKAKLIQLQDRTGKYADLPTKVYYKNDGEAVQIYGLNFGDTDAIGASLAGYTPTSSWNVSPSTDAVRYWDALAVKDPNTQQVWPIFQNIIDSSNGMLDNKFLGL